MYIFGGKNECNEKLNDFWRLDLSNMTWEQLPTPDNIAPRSGHSCNIYKDKLIIFGGIQEITKELDDLISYDF